MKRPEDMDRDELVDEVAYLRGELGLSLSVTRADRLAKALGLTPSEAALALTLHSASGRTLSKYQLSEGMPQKWGGPDRDIKIIDVTICKLRGKIGKDTILTVWGRGYRLSDAGLSALNRLLKEQPVEQAA